MKRTPLKRSPFPRQRKEAPRVEREPHPKAEIHENDVIYQTVNPAISVKPLRVGTYAGATSGEAIAKEVKAKPGKRTPTKEEREWMDKITAHGCIACRMDGRGFVPAAVHHILRGGQRIGHLFTLPLCDPGHHQNGAQLGMVSRHPWKARFEQMYGSEHFLLALLQAELGKLAGNDNFGEGKP